MLLSIILPVHNQADHIEPIVREYEAGLERLSDPHELLLVTNGCTDRSPAVCNALAAEFATVRVLHNEQRGWGRAVVRGLEAAKGDILCYTNCARTTAQDLLLLLVYATIYPRVVVKANRKIREGTVRRLGSLLYNLECRSLFDLPTWDINGTPKVFPRSYEKLVTLTRQDDLIDAEFNVICRRERYPVVEVPIFSNRRHGGRSTTNLASALKMYTGAYRMWASDPARRSGQGR
jgi:glycosyltransferase involved in cell wall biosynthesis